MDWISCEEEEERGGSIDLLLCSEFRFLLGNWVGLRVAWAGLKGRKQKRGWATDLGKGIKGNWAYCWITERVEKRVGNQNKPQK